MNLIYCIHCPISHEPKYIGKTRRSIELRFNEHLKDVNKKSRRYCKLYVWLRDLRAKGLQPYYTEIDTIENNIDFWETHYISLFRSWGFPLLNMTSGGDGGKLDSETRQRISKTLTGRKIPIDVVEKIRKWQTGRKKKDKTNYKADHCKKLIEIDGKSFPSLTDARNALGIARTTFHRHYTLNKKPKDLSVEYNGVLYGSIRQAAKATGIGRYRMTRLIKNIYSPQLIA